MRNPIQLESDFIHPCVFSLSLACFMEHLESFVNVMSFVAYQSNVYISFNPKSVMTISGSNMVYCSVRWHLKCLLCGNLKQNKQEKGFPSMCFQNKTDAEPPVSTRILSPRPRHLVTDAFCCVSWRISWKTPSLSVFMSRVKKSWSLWLVPLGSWLLGWL